MLHTSLLRGGELIRGKLKIKNKKFVDFIGNNLSARLVGVIIVDSKWAREEWSKSNMIGVFGWVGKWERKW